MVARRHEQCICLLVVACGWCFFQAPRFGSWTSGAQACFRTALLHLGSWMLLVPAPAPVLFHFAVTFFRLCRCWWLVLLPSHVLRLSVVCGRLTYSWLVVFQAIEPCRPIGVSPFEPFPHAVLFNDCFCHRLRSVLGSADHMCRGRLRAGYVPALRIPSSRVCVSSWQVSFRRCCFCAYVGPHVLPTWGIYQ